MKFFELKMVSRKELWKNYFTINRALIFGLSFSSETDVIVKKMKQDFKRIFLITGSPEQYIGFFKTEEDTEELSENECGNVVFVDMLDYNQKQADPFFTSRRQNVLAVFHLS